MRWSWGRLHSVEANAFRFGATHKGDDDKAALCLRRRTQEVSLSTIFQVKVDISQSADLARR